MITEQENLESGWVARFLAFWVALVCRAPKTFLAGALILVALSVYFAATQLTHQTRRDDLLSPHKDFYKRWQQHVKEFGEDDDMVVVVQGPDPARMKQALDELATALDQQPDTFKRLFYQVDLRHLRNRGLLFLPVEQIRSIQENLRDMNLLLDTPVLGGFDPLFSWKSVTLQMLVLEGQRRLAALGSTQAESSSDIRVLRQLDAVCRAAANTLDRPGTYHSPWHDILPRFPEGQNRLDEPHYFFSGDRKLAFLLVCPIRENNFTGTARSVGCLRDLMNDVAHRFPDLKIGLTGLPVLENDEMIASDRDSKLAAWLALAGISLLYLVFYRRWRYPVFTVATLLVGTAWSMGWVTLTVGHLNILSAAFMVMLIGMGDYGVLWVTRFGQERQAGAELLPAMQTTAISVGPSILVAGITTALAFFATMLADFKAIVELGWIAGCGILFCVLACFIVMPALLTLWDGRRGRTGAAASIIPLEDVRSARRQWLPWLLRRPRLVLGCSAAVMVVLAISALGLRYDHNLLNMQARNLDSVRWEETLIRHTSGASWHALSHTTTPEEAMALKARFEALPAVSQVAEVASLIPRDQDRKLEQLRDIQFRLRRLPPRGQRISHLLPRVSDLRRSLDRLLDDLDFTTSEKHRDLLTSLKKEARRLRDKLLGQDAAMLARTLQDFEERMTTDLAEDLHRLRDVSHPEPITVADLPASLKQRYIGKNGKWLVCVFAKESLWDYQPLEEFIAQVQLVDPEATGKPFTTLEGLRAMKQGFLWATLYASLAMVLVLLLDFRNWKYTLLAMAPVIMGLCITFGIMVLLGIHLNPANMIALPLILGVGMDNGVHVLHDYRSHSSGHYSLNHATGRGILVAGLTTILGFGALMISGHRGIASLGLSLSLGVSCCMLGALVTLPALLRLHSLRRKAPVKVATEYRRAA